MAAGSLATYRSWLLKSDQAETNAATATARPNHGPAIISAIVGQPFDSLQTAGSVVVPRPARTGMRYEAAIKGRVIRRARG